MATLKVPDLAGNLRKEWARVKRERGAITQKTWAAEHGFDQAQFSAWLGGTTPTFETLKDLGKAFGVPWELLLVGEDAARQIVAFIERRDNSTPVAAPGKPPPRVKSRASDQRRAVRR